MLNINFFFKYNYINNYVLVKDFKFIKNYRYKYLKIRGKARRLFLLDSRIKLKLGYTHKLFFFLYNLVWSYIGKYSLMFFILNRSVSKYFFKLQWFLPRIYSNLGINFNLTKKFLKVGKLSSYKK